MQFSSYKSIIIKHQQQILHQGVKKRALRNLSLPVKMANIPPFLPPSSLETSGLCSPFPNWIKLQVTWLSSALLTFNVISPWLATLGQQSQQRILLNLTNHDTTSPILRGWQGQWGNGAVHPGAITSLLPGTQQMQPAECHLLGPCSASPSCSLPETPASCKEPVLALFITASFYTQWASIHGQLCLGLVSGSEE